MLNLNAKEINFGLAIIAIVALTVVALFGVTSGMAMRSDGTMENCLFARSQALCPMAFSEHLKLWQNMLVFNLPKATIFLNVIVMLLALVIISIAYRKHYSSLVRHAVSQTLFQKQRNPLLFFDYLKEAFSRGILNPKIYEATF